MGKKRLIGGGRVCRGNTRLTAKMENCPPSQKKHCFGGFAKRHGGLADQDLAEGSGAGAGEASL